MLMEGKVVVDYFFMAQTLSGLKYWELPTGLPATRNVKFSHMAKDQLGKSGKEWRGKVITRTTRMPLITVIAMYEAYVEAYRAENQNVLSENITDYLSSTQPGQS